jgi:hypothetical protein
MASTSNLRKHFIQVRYFLIFIIAKNAKETLKYPLEEQRPPFFYLLFANKYYDFFITLLSYHDDFLVTVHTE